ncbi:hypothetical protein PROFUN_06987 [Planoprotostelium fungivorum]|uniref:Uncharacterized protein n=1 Tax=Planoprotostelium fungivorum TaxID=1890364 RepID=A0A2P6NMN9_9EUKA|nr:hypothetical protein PROFUN_06987 [Planoprotostelium fungivorum]
MQLGDQGCSLCAAGMFNEDWWYTLTPSLANLHPAFLGNLKEGAREATAVKMTPAHSSFVRVNIFLCEIST